MVFTGDSNYVAQWYNGQTYSMVVIEAATGKQMRGKEYALNARCAHVRTDGRFQVNACGDDTVRVIEIATARKVSRARFGNSARPEDPAGPVSLSFDARYLAALPWDAGFGGGHELGLLEAATAKEIFKTELDRDVVAVEFSPDGRYLAAHDGTTVRVVNGGPSGTLKHRE